jgi:hypothetical protein
MIYPLVIGSMFLRLQKVLVQIKMDEFSGWCFETYDICFEIELKNQNPITNYNWF